MSRNETATFQSELEAAISIFGIEKLTGEQTTRLVRHYSMLRRWNQRLNLTRITEPREAARLHYAESLFGASLIVGARTLLDIGSGAGFPAIPLAVLRPELQITALEANHKKALFLMEVKDELGLANLKVVTARLEEFDWGSYELLTSRAIEKAEFVFRPVVERLSVGQKLMFFCTRDLVDKLSPETKTLDIYPIPMSDSRIIAVIN